MPIYPPHAIIPAKEAVIEMKYIHSIKGWPCFYWDTDYLAPTLAQTRYQQGLFYGSLQKMDSAARKEAMTQVLIADAAASSSLEGISLNKNAALQLLGGAKKSRASKKTPQGMGLVKVLGQVTSNPDALLTAARICEWHALVMDSASPTAGWRSENEGDKSIVHGPLGWEKVQYSAPAAQRLPQEMKTFLAWFNFGSLPGIPDTGLWQDPLIKAGIAQFWFLCIHPFTDGSARLGRAICDLALLRADPGKAYYSLNERVLQEKKEYQNAIGKAQRGSLDITPWLDWFLHAVQRAVNTAESLIAPALRKDKAYSRMQSSGLSERQKKIVELLINGELEKIASSNYAGLTGCSPDTALRDIHDMMQKGLLRQSRAGGRSTSYSLKL